MLSKSFWKDALERAVKTAAQTAVALIGTGAIGIIDVDWTNIASVSGVAALVSMLTSISSGSFGSTDSSSLERGDHADLSR